MKFSVVGPKNLDVVVAPYAGAWIEILRLPILKNLRGVAPYAGAWIEMPVLTVGSAGFGVAPYAGAWIEIPVAQFNTSAKVRRSLRGSVD